MLSTKAKIRTAEVLSRAVRAVRRLTRANHDVVEVKRGGIWWRLDLCEAIDFAIYLLGTFEYPTVQAYRRVIRPPAVAFDIGANVGAHTLPLASLVGNAGRVYAFEPTVYALGKLQRNLALNPELAARVITEQVMLTDLKDALAEPEVYSSWPLNCRIGLHDKHLGRPKATTGARAVRLDDYVTAAGITRIDFIKLDVDGFECHVLGGGAALLKTERPVILMEVAPYALTERGRSLEELVDLLRCAGYRLHHLYGEKVLPDDSRSLRMIIPEGASMNVIARPMRCSDASISYLQDARLASRRCRS